MPAYQVRRWLSEDRQRISGASGIDFAIELNYNQDRMNTVQRKDGSPMTTRIRRTISLVLAVLLALALAPLASAASDYDRPGQKLLALTFDDGPGPYSDQILDTLAAHNAKATFFMNGYKVRRYADQVRRMADEGHQIANHTYNHPYLTKCSDAKLRQEMDATAEAFTEVTGLTGTGNTGFYMRPPYGAFNHRVTSLVGVPVIWCTVDSGDWKYQSASRLVSYTGSVVKDGDIVVMHEIHKSTAQGLGNLLDTLQTQGFEMVTLEDLFWRRGIEPQPGVVYYSAKNTGVDRCEKALWFDESRLDAHWAWPEISSMRDKGIMTGNPYGEFLPNFPMTRGMFVTCLGRLAGMDPADWSGATGFRDVAEDHYAAPYVRWAGETGLMQGTSEDTFSPNETITRQEMAAVLARFIRSLDVEGEPFDLSVYRDQESISSWATDGVALCSSLGILQGSDGQFRPKDPTTRAMAAAVLARLDGLGLTESEETATDMEEPGIPEENELAEEPVQSADEGTDDTEEISND